MSKKMTLRRYFKKNAVNGYSALLDVTQDDGLVLVLGAADILFLALEDGTMLRPADGEEIVEEVCRAWRDGDIIGDDY